MNDCIPVYSRRDLFEFRFEAMQNALDSFAPAVCGLTGASSASYQTKQPWHVTAKWSKPTSWQSSPSAAEKFESPLILG